MKENLVYYRDLAIYYREQAFTKLGLGKLSGRVQEGILIALVLLLVVLGVGIKHRLTLNNEPAPQPSATVSSQAMPDLKGSSLIDAQQKLQSLGLNNISQEELQEFAGDSRNDTVIDQAPQAGLVVKTTDKIILRYGDKTLYKKSTTVVTMPSVIGMSYTAARSKLQTMGYAKVTGELPKGVLEPQAIIADQDPAAGTEGSLNDPVVLTPKAGFAMADLRTKLQGSFAPYSRLSKVESPGGLNLRLTLKQTDATLKNPTDLNQRARAYKVGIEQALGYTIGKVYLVNPNTPLVGDSSQVQRSATSAGLTKDTAQQQCDSAIQSGGTAVDINWDSGILSELVDDQNITITATGNLQNTSGTSTQEVVVTCVVTGTNDAPQMVSSSVK